MMCAFFNFFLYFSACVTGTQSSFFEKSKCKCFDCFSRSDKSDFRLNPPARYSSEYDSVLSNGGAIRYVESIFFGNLCSDKYFARNIPPSDTPINMMLFWMCRKCFSKLIFHSVYCEYSL